MKLKMPRILTITALLVGLTINSSCGQTFTIESFDGAKQLIQVSADENKRILSIKCANNAIHIGGINTLDTVQLLNKHFLLVTYQPRTGTGMYEIKTVIISAKNQALYESLHVVSLFKEEFIDFSKPMSGSSKVSVHTLLTVGLTLTGSTADNYKIRAKIHDANKSTDEPKDNYTYDFLANLTFDQNKNIFYSSQDNVSQRFTIIDAKKRDKTKQIIKGLFPVAKLGRQKYYYKNGGWYEFTELDNLTQESYR